MSKYPQELLDAMEDAVDAHGMAYLNHQSDGRSSMCVALEAADKWRAEHAAKQDAKVAQALENLAGDASDSPILYFDMPVLSEETVRELTGDSLDALSYEPIGVPVTDIDTLRVGDRVSFLAGDRDERFYGTVDKREWQQVQVACDGGHTPCRTNERHWWVDATDWVDPYGWRDLRLASRAPVETAPGTKASAADAQAVTEPAPKVEYATREEVDAIKASLTSVLRALTQIAAFSGLLESSMSTLLSSSDPKEPPT